MLLHGSAQTPHREIPKVTRAAFKLIVPLESSLVLCQLPAWLWAPLQHPDKSRDDYLLLSKNNPPAAVTRVWTMSSILQIRCLSIADKTFLFQWSLLLLFLIWSFILALLVFTPLIQFVMYLPSVNLFFLKKLLELVIYSLLLSEALML